MPTSFAIRRRHRRVGLLSAVAVAAASAVALADDYPVAPFNGPLDASNFHRVAASGVSAVPGFSGVTFTSTRLAGVEGSDSAFLGAYTDPIAHASRSGLFDAHSDGSVSLIAGPGSVTVGGETITTVIGNGEWIDGQLTFAANTSAGQAIYRIDTNTKALTKLISAGQTLANSESPVATFIAKGVAGDNHGYAFTATLADGTKAMYQSTGNEPASVLKISDDKTRAPGSSGVRPDLDYPEVAYRSGTTAYIARALESDADVPTPEPIGVVLASPGNPDRLPVYKTGAIPGAPDEELRFREFEKPRLFDRAGEATLGFTGGFEARKTMKTPMSASWAFSRCPTAA